MKLTDASKSQRKPDSEFADKLGVALFGYVLLLAVLSGNRFPAYIDRVKETCKAGENRCHDAAIPGC